jgi:FixJ family two-component response regulator
VLVVAPVAGDGPAVASLLNERGLVAEVYQSLTEVCAQVAAGAGALLLTEEALELAQTPELLDQLKAQPPWSELPVIILTHGGESHLARLLELAADAAGAITLLERPISTVTLLRSI